ncbi:MAG TPA: two-component regulator propeller domain-containing protein, partial [Blastocatellia bacterium]|nr:two-component regulator propeller domain-containing protein [Blastocatellia bacterium]
TLNAISGEVIRMRASVWQENRILVRISFLLGLLLSLLSLAPAEQLPVRTYTTADGLPRDYVQRIVPDSHGFLWFCTGDGLSRFNGYEFTTYGVEHGLPHPSVTDLIETRQGIYWVATNGGGVCRFNPAQPLLASNGGRSAGDISRFTVYPVGAEPMSNRVEVLHEDRNGQIWAGTDAGLFRLDETNGQAAFQRVALSDQMVVAFAEDNEGSLWMSTSEGLVRRLPDGRTVRYLIQPSPFGNLFTVLLFDTEGRLWVGHRGGAGLIVLKPQPATSITASGEQLTLRLARCGKAGHSLDQRVRLPVAPGDVCEFTTADGLAGIIVGGISQSSEGQIWIATSGGLTEFKDGRFRSYTTSLGLINLNLGTPVEDRDGNLWLGSLTGATKITWSGFTTFGKADGLTNLRINSIIENRRGDLCSISAENDFFVNQYDGRRFTPIKPQFPREIKSFGWGWNQVTFQDHTGEWWVPTSSGLCRFPQVASVEQLARTRPKAVYTHQRGELTGDDIFRLFEDSRGDVWISISGYLRNAAVRWERATESFHVCSEAEGLPPFGLPTAFCEDAAGNLWLGFYDGGLARYRDGRFQLFAQSDGVPAGLIRALYLDHAGRLWVASDRDAIARLDDPQAEHPSFVKYTMADGLASNGVSCITEDKLGRMYFGTTRSLDRLDLETNRIRHYTKADGLASNAVRVAFRDREGALWFGTDLGISRLIPGLDPPTSPPPILISGLRIAGDVQPISALGETEVSGLVLNPTQNQLSIDFVGLGFAAGEALRYQYRFAGSEWSAPTDQRTINYASLSPGRYQFQVQAVTADGNNSPTPATITFTILPPVWQRWWFVSLVALTVGLIAWVIYRYRVGRLIELERVRTRIATDLHDDIGSGLSQIALISEVVRRRVNRDDPPVRESLAQIAGSSRELVDSMSDIVWAVDPRKDHLSDLTQRMRRFASEVFTARDIAFRFHERAEAEDAKLSADVRRQVFLIFKESVNNIVRHSGCKEADIEFRFEHGWLTLKVSDDGKGFDSEEESDGHGLMSMRERAKALGGDLEVISHNGDGTTVMLRVAVSRRSVLQSLKFPHQ